MLWVILLEWKILNIAASKLCFTLQSATKQHSATFLHSAPIFWFILWFLLWFIMSHAGICHTDICSFCAISINGLSPIVNWFVTLSVVMDSNYTAGKCLSFYVWEVSFVEQASTWTLPITWLTYTPQAFSVYYLCLSFIPSWELFQKNVVKSFPKLSLFDKLVAAE